jgi:hypothetical protein
VLFVQKGQVKRLSLFDIEAKFKGNSLIYFFMQLRLRPLPATNNYDINDYDEHSSANCGQQVD